jgi:hypothetical protein
MLGRAEPAAAGPAFYRITALGRRAYSAEAERLAGFVRPRVRRNC